MSWPLCYWQKCPSLVQDCTQLCRKNKACKAIIIDYRELICHGLMAPNVPEMQLTISTDKDYFLAICVARHAPFCNKLWLTERIIDQTFSAQQLQPRIQLPFATIAACRLLCLQHKQFTCTAYSFDMFHKVCRLYDQDRHWLSIPLTFTPGTNLYENQCAFRQVRCRYSPFERDVTMVSLTSSLKVTSSPQCQYACDNEKQFTYRSFTYVVDESSYRYGSNSVCLLSGDNRASSKADWTRYLAGAYYYERQCQTASYPPYWNVQRSHWKS